MRYEARLTSGIKRGLTRYASGFFYAWKGLITMTEEKKPRSKPEDAPQEKRKLPPVNPYMMLLMYGIKNDYIEIPSEEELEEDKEYINRLIDAVQYLCLGEKRISLKAYLQNIVDSYGIDSEDGKVQEFCKGYERGYRDRENNKYESVLSANVTQDLIWQLVNKARTAEKEGEK